MVTRADGYIGRILAMLAEFGLDRDTAVFIASDNGAHSGGDKGYELFRSNGALRGEKGQLYEGGIRVPMIVRWPGRVPAGTVREAPWAFWDFLPTAAAIAGVAAPAGLDGIAMLPLLTAGRAPAREFLYWEFDAWDQKTGKLRPARLAQAVRTGEWKAVRSKPGAPLELYNLARDPGETKDIAAVNPRVVARIEEYLKTARTEPRPHPGSMQFVK